MTDERFGIARTAPSSAFAAGQPRERADDDRPVRVVLVGGDEITVNGLKGMLGPHRDGLVLVGCIPLTDDALSLAGRLGADVVLVDIESEGTNALELLAGMMADKPPLRVVIFTDHADARRLLEALRLGIWGYLRKSSRGAELAEQLGRVGHGEVVVDPTMAAQVALRAAMLGHGRTWPGSEIGLSQRESEVLSLLVEGLSNRQIATRLIVGEETVKTHLRSIYRKLKVNDRAQAVAAALRQGIFT